MNFKDMLYLKTIAENKSFSRAAQELFLSQPALSRTVRQVEEEYGVKLFQRMGKNTVPTEEGMLVLQSAERILEIRRQMEEHFIRASSQSPPVILMFSDQIMPVYYAAAELIQGEDIRLEQIIAHQDWMETVPWDLYLTVLKYVPEREEVVMLREVGLCCVMDQAHPLAEKSEIQLSELKHVPLLLPVPDSSTRNVIDEIFAKYQFSPCISMESDNYPSYEDFLRGRNWVALAPDYSAGLQDSSILFLRPWAEFSEEHHRYLCLIRNKNKQQSAHAAMVEKRIIEVCSAL